VVRDEIVTAERDLRVVGSEGPDDGSALAFRSVSRGAVHTSLLQCVVLLATFCMRLCLDVVRQYAEERSREITGSTGNIGY
jgi:hypothetical protein